MLVRLFALLPPRVSAGMDCAHGEPIGGEMHVSAAGFAHMTALLQQVAPKGRVVLALEGGYNVDAIAQATRACVKVLLGDALPELPVHDWFLTQDHRFPPPRSEPASDADEDDEPPESLASLIARVAANRKTFARELESMIKYQQRHWACLTNTA
jgi:hypothetical protein